MGDQVATGVNFVSDWLREARRFPGQITEQSKAKPMQSRVILDTKLLCPAIKSHEILPLPYIHGS